MRGARIYLRERFPLALVSLMSASFAAASLGLLAPAGLTAADVWAAAILLFVMYLALLLRYRVTDEWKDFAHDSAVYPDRPVQRGVISPRTLLVIGIGAFAVELLCGLLLGGLVGFLLYLPVLAYSALTVFEFFAGSWLDRHFTLSFLLHEAIYLPLFAWVAFVLGASWSWRTVAGILACTLLLVSVELARKFSPRFDTAGAVVLDTYSAVWGRGRTLGAMVMLVVLSGGLAMTAGAGLASLAIAALSAIVIVVRPASDRWVTAVVAIHLPLQAAAMLS
ncbi:4-hydroxybenzoate polyprenyltransferase [Agreia pratensis]|uniref:4-hydroxybenzoate polyprenyltransferase n=2 Tax=Agreia pratensis TaxID=150121 RepID=A0A1X7JRJ7_9MICO|nr:4-hydroxybenzoate polyprenyltransferase [Agreia pratensis]